MSREANELQFWIANWQDIQHRKDLSEEILKDAGWKLAYAASNLVQWHDRHQQRGLRGILRAIGLLRR